MKDKKYLVVLKNPPASFMVDGFVGKKFLKGVKNLSCFQDGQALCIPYAVDCNIAYITEMTTEEILEMEESIEAQNEKRKALRAKLIKVKPHFDIPSKKTH